jgi:hypothetical protein
MSRILKSSIKSESHKAINKWFTFHVYFTSDACYEHEKYILIGLSIIFPHDVNFRQNFISPRVYYNYVGERRQGHKHFTSAQLVVPQKKYLVNFTRTP